MSKQPTYKLVFYNQGQVYELYARQIFQSYLMGFIEIEEFVSGERTQLIVDPAEEKLKNEFKAINGLTDQKVSVFNAKSLLKLKPNTAHPVSTPQPGSPAPPSES